MFSAIDNTYYAQDCLIYGLLLQSQDLIPRLGMLTPEMLLSQKHRETFAVILEVWEKLGRVDLFSVIRYSQDKGLSRTELIRILDNSLPDCNFEGLRDSLITDYKARKLQSIGVSLTNQVPFFDPDIAIAELENQIQPLKVTNTPSNSPITVSEAFLEYFARLEEISQSDGNPDAVCTGFYDLDEILGGGLAKGDLVIVAGRPAMGKSAWALQVGFNFAKAKGKKALFFSLEMPKKQLMDRLVSQLCGIEVTFLSNGKISQNQWEKILEVHKVLDNAPLLIADNLNRNWQQIENEIRIQHTKSDGELELVIIDYLQLLVEGDDIVRELGKATRAFKLLAVELGISIVLLSQLNRSVEQRRDKRPQLSDLRDSGCIEQDSDKVFAIYRDEYYNPDTCDRGLAEIILLKNRTGPTGTVKLLFEGSLVQFRNLAKRWEA